MTFWKKKHKIPQISLTVVGSIPCPSCGEYGLFKYERDEIESHPEPFALCESCLKRFELDDELNIKP